MLENELERNIACSNHYENQKTQIRETITAYEKKIQEYTTAIRELYMDKVKGILTESDYLDLSKAFTSEKSRLEQNLGYAKNQLTEIEMRKETGNQKKALIEKYMNMEHLTREMVDALIDHIDVGRRIPGTKDVPITIYWNF